MKLFEHNRTAYESALSLLFKTGRAAVIHPTGTGKSFIGFQLCEDHPNQTVCWVSPSEYIFRTQLENLKTASGADPQNIKFCTYAKLMNMDQNEIVELRPSFIVLDEFHRAGAVMWSQGVKRLLEAYPEAPVLGLSATSIRYLDNQRDMADELFDGNIASEMTLGECIVRGILQPPKYVLSAFAYQKDLKRYQARVRKAKSKATRDAAELVLEALRRALEKADGLDVVFDKHMTDRTGKYIVFSANKEHMDGMIAKSQEWFSLVDPSPRIYSVYSEDPGASRSFAEFKADVKKDHLRLLYCIDALNEGIHVEDVSGVILLRPTVSPIIYKQQIGRALSAGESREPVIFDIVMNIENLYSIDSLQEEMRAAMTYYRLLGEDREIVREQFQIYDELRDCRKLFEKLNETLTASWDTMYAHAKAYYEAWGNLDVPKKYKTAGGYSLGYWIATQRRVYNGEVYGVLGKDRVEKLNAIGMEWDSFSERSWKRYFAAAKVYSKNNGNLRVPMEYITPDGVKLGKWIFNLRIYRKNDSRPRYLSDVRMKALDRLGMIWNIPDYQWEKFYNAAMQYHREHGNLDVSVEYVTRDGLRLGLWLNNMRESRRMNQHRLTEERIAKLDELGMIWEKKYQRQWEKGYTAAQQYYWRHGNLNVSVGYKDASGYRLGDWIANQREAFRGGTIKPERIRRLEDIGMVWEKVDPWEARFALAEAYFREFGNLNVPGSYTVDGICLGKWINEQKNAYRGKRPKQPLTDEQVRRLESIGMEWRNSNVVVWEARYQAVKTYYDEHGNIDIPKSTILSDGRKLGEWLSVQRRYYKAGKLTQEQIEKLNAIKMIWELPDPWSIGFEHAKEYAAQHGNLRIPPEHVCEDGYRLGGWIVCQRNRYNNPTKYHSLTKEKTEKLESIGMIWDLNDYQWQQVYIQAETYFQAHGNLNVPARYKTGDGADLHEWVRAQREKYRRGSLPDEYIEKLQKIGMDWMTPAERNWEDWYADAERYFLLHGNLNVPLTWRTPEGRLLGRWLERQQRNSRKLKRFGMNGDQVSRLEAIGMKWKTGAEEHAMRAAQTERGGREGVRP